MKNFSCSFLLASGPIKSLTFFFAPLQKNSDKKIFRRVKSPIFDFNFSYSSSSGTCAGTSTSPSARGTTSPERGKRGSRRGAAWAVEAAVAATSDEAVIPHFQHAGQEEHQGVEEAGRQILPRVGLLRTTASIVRIISQVNRGVNPIK